MTCQIRKFILIFLLASGIFTFSLAQNFIDDSKIWVVSTISPTMDGEVGYFTCGDTVLDGKDYSKLFMINPRNYLAGLREENGQVFLKAPDFSEALIYDFNLMPGDTFEYVMFQGVAYFDHLISLEEEFIYEDLRKVYTFASGEQWVEEIGNTRGPLYFITTPNTELSGFIQNEEVVFCYELFQYDCAYYQEHAVCLISKTSVDMDKKNVFLYPNPTTSDVTISISGSNDLENREVRLLTTDGEVVKRKRMIGWTAMNFSTEGLAPGIYFVQILSADGSYSHTWKLIKN